LWLLHRLNDGRHGKERKGGGGKEEVPDDMPYPAGPFYVEAACQALAPFSWWRKEVEGVQFPTINLQWDYSQGA